MKDNHTSLIIMWSSMFDASCGDVPKSDSAKDSLML